MNLFRLCISLFAWALSTFCLAANNNETAVFNPAVRTLRAYVAGTPLGPMSMPVMTLGDDRPLVVDFDLLEDEHRYLRYSIAHLDAVGTNDRLAYPEFLDGFNEGQIDDYAYSEATSVPYVHYRLEIPDGQMRPLVSGNYLLTVWPEGNPSEPLFQVRFAVSEQLVPLAVGVTSRTDIDYNAHHQQLDVTALLENTPVRNPYNDLIMVVEQNGRPDTRRVIEHPLRVTGSKAVYEHVPQLIFPAGNEYRRFETISKRYNPIGVAEFGFKNPYYHYVLFDDEPRTTAPYSFDRTLSGGYLIRDADDDVRAEASDVSADYAIVFFRLHAPGAYAYNIYLDTDATQRRLDSTSLMDYDPSEQVYTKALLLKQGSYSYQYLAVPKSQTGVGQALTAPVEGDKFETQNIYNIYLYLRHPSQRYDRLVGYTTIAVR